MSKKYQNYMEVLVESRIDELKDSLNCCLCDQCRNDIVAYALNQLPTKYVVTEIGGVYSKLNMLGLQHDADILSAIMKGVEMVKENPRH